MNQLLIGKGIQPVHLLGPFGNRHGLVDEQGLLLLDLDDLRALLTFAADNPGYTRNHSGAENG